MPQGAALSEQSSGEGITHVASIRVRVNGRGLLQVRAWSLDKLRVKEVPSIVMQPLIRHSQTRLINFVEQRVMIDLRTKGFNEKFRINRIVIFTKGIYKSLPGN